jgi:ATP-dependent helicase STH1/SNF2
MRQQIQASQLAAAQTASPMPTTTLNTTTMPKTLGGETLAALLRLTTDSPQPLLDAKVGDLYRRTIPMSLPVGIRAETLAGEWERLRGQAVAERVQTLENLLSEDEQNEALSSTERTKLLIELKTLKLSTLQRKVRLGVLRAVHDLRSVDSYADRAGLRRGKKQSLREARLTERNEQLQRRNKSDKERRAHLDFLSSVLSHGRELQTAWRSSTQKRARLVKQVMHYHGNFEREEQKRQERVQKDRLKALKADDEDAYIKLLDREKDTRLTYLLEQTDEFLSGLAAKVAAQQQDSRRKMTPEEELDEQEEEPEAARYGDYLNTAHKKKEIVEEQPKMLVGGKLKDYQVKGLQWMVSLYNNHLNGMLADEMGLGKTIQTISLIAYLLEKKAHNGPYLIVVPLSTMTNWAMEFKRWVGDRIKVIEYKGAPQQRKLEQDKIKHGQFNVLLTTYEYVIKDRPFLSKIRWLYLIVDEGHRMKNSRSKLTTVLTQYYQMRFRLILTGTPLQNNLPELWALLNFLLPHVFNSCTSFEEWFNTPFANTGERMELNEEEVLLIIRRLHKVLRPFLLRRMKRDVEAELPDKVEVLLKCPMSALQQNLYNAVAKRSATALRDPQNVGIKRLNNTIMQLRKLCNHPFVFEEVEQQMNPSHVNNELLYRAAGKFELLQRILPKFKATGHKVLMFFQMTQIMTIMEDLLAMQGYRYLRLDGSTKAEDRTDLLRKFSDPAEECFIFLLSTRAGGLGLNLQSADTVIIFDSDWNPHQDLQAQDRAHRIGQTKEVRIFRLITIESVEEYILERAQQKLSLDGKIIQAGKFDHKSTNEERDEMLRAIMEREAAKSDEEDIYDDEELNEIIARNDEELTVFKRLDEEREQVERQRTERTGVKQARLLEASELPKIFLAPVEGEGEEEAIDDEAALLMDPTRRRKKNVNTYDESMSDAAWLAALERDSTPVSSTTSSQPPSTRKRRTREVVFTSESEASPRKTPRISLKIRRTPQVQADSLDDDSRQTIMRSIYDAVENCTEFEGTRYRSDLFLELPDRVQYPDYYELIKAPLCLSQVETRLPEYQSVHAFMADLELIWRNAQQYNVEGSQVWEDAQVMRQLANDRLAELLEAEGRFNGSGSAEDEILSDASQSENVTNDEQSAYEE